MKKYSFIALALVVISSCIKEKTPDGLDLTPPNVLGDTTYMVLNPGPPQTKKILIEEATGVRCSNCPDGALIVEGLKNNYPNRILSVGIYSPFLNGFFHPATHDFNIPAALELVNLLGGEPNKPAAAIDRMITTDQPPHFFNKSSWSSTVATRLSATTPVNIELQTEAVGGENYIVSSKLVFTDTITAILAITMYLIEDDIVNNQLITVGSSTFDSLTYKHHNALSQVLTPVSGAIFLNDIPTKEKGRVFERKITFQLPENIIDKKNCKVLCFVHKAGASGLEVLHAEEIELE